MTNLCKLWRMLGNRPQAESSGLFVESVLLAQRIHLFRDVSKILVNPQTNFELATHELREDLVLNDCLCEVIAVVRKSPQGQGRGLLDAAFHTRVSSDVRQGAS